MNHKTMTAGAIFLFVAFLLFSQEKADETLLLQIGDKALKDKAMNIVANTIYSSREGKPIAFSRMIEEMSASRFIYVGETHNSLPMHDIQLKVIQALYAKDKKLAIGLEMFPVPFQEALNKWSLGLLSRDEFIRVSQWYVNWNYNFGFYERIFEFAKDYRIPLYALNAPSETITKIRMAGWEALSEEEKKFVPKPDLSHEQHRMLVRKIFESMELPPQMKGKGLDMAFEGLYRAQSAWDEVMAFHAFQTQEREGGRIVVLAGSGHLLYNLGINRRVFEKSRLSFKTLICVTVPEGKGSVPVSRSLADYIWGIPEEPIPAFPSIGLRFKKFDGLDNLVVDSKPVEGVAEKANFEKGDVILFVDGQRFLDINELRIYLATFGWNDEVKFSLLRNAQPLEVGLKFQPPQKKEEK